MRRTILLLLCMLMLASSAGAAGLSGLVSAAQLNDLPDPKELLSGGALFYDGRFALDDDMYGVAYIYPMPEEWNLFLLEYTARCEAGEYTVEKGVQLFQPAWKVESKGKCAWLLPDYKGSLLMVVDAAIPFTPVPTPEPTATPRPTAAPTPVPDGHWETIAVQRDCFACAGGICDLCDGSGWYRAYGEKVSCSRYCKTCDGLGWWESTSSIWVCD